MYVLDDLYGLISTSMTGLLYGLNNLGTVVTGFPAYILNLFVSSFVALVYPIAVLVYTFLQIFSALWVVVATFVNAIIVIANLPLYLIQSFFILPLPWTNLLLISISISCAVRAYRWIKEFKGWIPTLTGDN